MTVTDDDGAPQETNTVARAIWPWVARPTRGQIGALIVISVLAFGPLVALLVSLQADSAPVDTLAEPESAAPEQDLVTITALGLSPSQGELRVRVTLELRSDGLVSADGTLRGPVTVGVNDSQGSTVRTFDTDQLVAPFEVTVPVSEGSVTRYPFDRYRARFLVGVSDDDGEFLPLAATVRSAVDEFTLRVADPGVESESVTTFEWAAQRPASTSIYAVWLMVLMWGLAVVGLLIAWALVIWRVDTQPWIFGYFVGVLFALPPLRNSLPGQPPPGTLFDYVSFYWSITIVGTSLILVLVVWLRRERAQTQLRDLDGT